MSASKMGHEQIATALIAAKAKLDTTTAKGSTALSYALVGGNKQIALKLIAAGAAYNEDALVMAISGGDEQIAIALIAAKADVNTTRAGGITALSVATENNNKGIVSALIKAGALYDKDALWTASSTGDVQIAKALIAANADVDKVRQGYTALMRASKMGCTEIATALIAANANLDKKSKSGWTALSLAIEHDRKQIAAALITAGAAYNDDDLTVATINMDVQIATALITAGADVNKTIEDGNTALIVASSIGHIQIARALIAANASVSKANVFGDTALMSASGGGYGQIATALIAANADLNTSNNRGDTALSLALGCKHKELALVLIEAGAISNEDVLENASLEGDVQIATALIAAGADLNKAGGKRRSTALISATRVGNEQIALALIAAKADLNMTNTNGMTALMKASNKGHAQIATALIAATADLNTSNNRGDTALSLALAAKNKQIALMLIEAGATSDKGALESAALEGDVQIATALIAAGADPNPAGEHGSALISAARIGSGQIATALIAADADVNKVDYDGSTALILASKNGHEQIATALIAANANVNTATGAGGDTALSLALLLGGNKQIAAALIEAGAAYTEDALATAVSGGDEQIATALIAANADVNKTIGDGGTALTLAMAVENNQIASALIAAGAEYNDNDLLWAIEKGHNQIATALIAANADVNRVGKDGRRAIDVALSKKEWEMATAIFTSPTNHTLPKDISLLTTMLENTFAPSSGAGAAIASETFFKLAAAKDTSASAKLTDTNRPGETFLAKIWNAIVAANRLQPDPMWTILEQASKLYLQQDIAEATKQTEALSELCIKHAGGKGNQARYIASHEDLKRQPSYQDYIAKIKGISVRTNTRQNGIKPTQTTGVPLEQLYANCHAIKPRFDAFVTKICSMAQNKVILDDTLKSAFRSYQKAVKSANSTSAGNMAWDDVSACKDIIRGIAQMADLGKGSLLLDLFMGCDINEATHSSGGDSTTAGVKEKIVIVWCKDRWTYPTNGGWSDSLVNFYFADDETKTICELQLPHGDMMAIREAFGAHNGYDQLRKAVELLTITGHAEIVDTIAAKAKDQLNSGAPMYGDTPAARRESIDGNGSVPSDTLQQCLDAIEMLKREVAFVKTQNTDVMAERASVKADNLTLTAKVGQFENDLQEAGVSTETGNNGFGFSDGNAVVASGGDDADQEVFGGFGEQQQQAKISKLEGDIVKIAASSVDAATKINELDGTVSTVLARLDQMEAKQAAYVSPSPKMKETITTMTREIDFPAARQLQIAEEEFSGFGSTSTTLNAAASAAPAAVNNGGFGFGVDDTAALGLDL